MDDEGQGHGLIQLWSADPKLLAQTSEDVDGQ